MDEPQEPLARGAAKRQEMREKKTRVEALRWLVKPGVLVFIGALVLAAAGWAILARAVRRLPVQESTNYGIHVRLDDARWILDQMDHGENFRQPAAMMPDMPPMGFQRVTMYLALENRSDELREYHGEEFFLVPEIGEEVPPFGAVIGQASLEPGQTLNTAIHFDLDTTKPHGRLLVEWRHGKRSAWFPIPEPSEHFHLRPRGGADLPPDARMLLPIGKAGRGERLYAGTYGCAACHGDPAVPDSNNLGPHLGRIGAEAGGRIEDVAAEQYIYDSIIDPGSFIAPECKGGVPCDAPTAMPEYSSLVTVQDAADLLAYLLELQGG
ncbi:MAG TPA: c-type cytochrome [Thermoanaerobaculia bacterium]|nr:c-type cytochrome [Thermoanaerobaculia bacterium]